jgi:hypothetical protein
VADTAVFATDPDAAQGRNQAIALHVGGPSVAMTYITFQIIGAEEGSVVAARLILTGAGETAGAGGVVSILPEVWIDEAHMTFSNAPAYGGAAALTANGDPATYQSLEPGREIAIDISGSVTGDGVLTFVLVGTPDVVAAIASRESESPPRLIVTVEPTG